MATQTLSERADALEEKMIEELEFVVSKSALFNMADGKLGIEAGAKILEQHPGKRFLMGDDPRLPKMPPKPTLMDFFHNRFASTNHLLQSATHALKAGMNEKTILACLLHDISVGGFIKADHGYWGAQLIEPYVDEEVSWAIRAHQALRFFPDPSVGYEYPKLYIQYFGDEYEPDDYIKAAYEKARRAQMVHDRAPHHRARHLFLRSQRQGRVGTLSSTSSAAISASPRKGWAIDDSPVAHMWRTMIRPAKYL